LTGGMNTRKCIAITGVSIAAATCDFQYPPCSEHPSPSAADSAAGINWENSKHTFFGDQALDVHFAIPYPFNQPAPA